MSVHTEDGARYRRARRHFLLANPICWICGHAGSDQIDHAIPRSVMRTKLDFANWRPAHGTNGCPSCPRKPDGRPRRCNQERGARLQQDTGTSFQSKDQW